MSIKKKESPLKPPIGTPAWYTNFFDKLARVKVEKIDKSYISSNKIAPESSATSLISGLKFLGLFNDDGTATEKIKSLDIVGEEYPKNLEKVIREAYSVLFGRIKQLDKSPYEDILNSFKSDYDMAPSTASQAASIFISLAQRAKIPLSEEIVEKFKPDSERKKTKKELKKGSKNNLKKEKRIANNEENDQLPETVLAKFTLKDTGYVNIKNKDDYEIAEAYWKILQKKLGIIDVK